MDMAIDYTDKMEQERIVEEIKDGFRKSCKQLIGRPLDPEALKRVKEAVSQTLTNMVCPVIITIEIEKSTDPHEGQIYNEYTERWTWL